MDQIHISTELVIIGGGASFLAEFLRALILKIEDYPRLAAIWKYMPTIFGMLGVLLFPSVVPNVSTLILLAHGAASPAAFYIAYPLIKIALEKNIRNSLKLPAGETAPAGLPAEALAPVTVPSEGEKP